MGRSKSFEPEQALGAMLQVFWRKGYEGTSISDLEEATQLNKRSLYNAFGNKAEIFDAVLDAYGAMMGAGAVPLLQEPPCINNIVEFFKGMKNPEEGLGCLFTKTINERCLVDPASFGKVEAAILELESLFVRNLKPHTGLRKARQLGKFLTSNVQGLTTMSRLDPDSKRLAAVVTTLEEMLLAL